MKNLNDYDYGCTECGWDNIAYWVGSIKFWSTCEFDSDVTTNLANACSMLDWHLTGEF